MNSWLLLRAMVVKELRTFLRERNQWLGLLMPILICMIVICALGYTYRTARLEDPRIHSLLTATQDWSREAEMALRWGGIGVGVAVAMFLALGYLVPTILGSFAGEKENHTLEVVLASRC